MQGFGCRVPGSGFRVLGFRYKVPGFGFRVKFEAGSGLAYWNSRNPLPFFSGKKYLATEITSQLTLTSGLDAFV